MFNKTKTDNQIDVEFFTIFDSKTHSYAEPSPARNTEDMIRALCNMFQDPGQSRNRYLLNAEDFSLFKIGGFSKTTGNLYNQNLEHVANLHDLRSLVQAKTQGPGIVPT